MALIDQALGFIDGLGWYVLPFVAIMSAIVFFHELGHYAVGRWCGVRIETFSLGFGPELLARVDSHGTRWRLGLIPLGGYVKFWGDADPTSVPDGGAAAKLDPAQRRQTLAGQKLPNRAAIVAAGPIANFVLAFVLFTALFLAFGRSELTPRIGYVEPDSPAALAGFAVNDLIKSIDGQPISSFQDLQQATMLSTGLPMTFVVDRAGADLTLYATPRVMLVDQGALGKRRVGHLGLGSSHDKADLKFERCGFPTCAVWAGEQIAFITHATGAYVGGLFAGRESLDQMSGPIAIAQMTRTVAKISFWELINIAAVLSVSVGLMNLLPIPLLDGGHLMFYLFEGICGRPLSDRVQQFGLRIGIALVAGLVLFTTSHDLLRGWL